MKMPGRNAVLLFMFAAACGKKSHTTDHAIQPVNRAEPVTIALDEIVSFKAVPTPSSEAPAPYTHAASQEYRLTLEAPTSVQIEPGDSYSACQDAVVTAGPFLSLSGSDGAMLTDDVVAHQDRAKIALGGERLTLPAGTANIVASVYASGSCLEAGMTFQIIRASNAQTDGSDSADGGGDGDGSGGDDGGDDGDGSEGEPLPTGVDSRLDGLWESPTDGTYADKLKLVSHTMTRTITVGTHVIYDVDYTMATDRAQTPARLISTVAIVRVDESDVPSVVGHRAKCIYAINETAAPVTLAMECAETSYPSALSADAELFKKSRPLPPDPRFTWRAEVNKCMNGLGAEGMNTGNPGECSDMSAGSSADLTGANLRGSKLAGGRFLAAKLTRADLSGAKATGVNFQDMALAGVTFEKAFLSNATFSRAKIAGANLKGADLTYTSFYQATLTDAKWVGATLTYTSFREAAVDRSDFTEAKFTGADFYHATATNSGFKGATFKSDTTLSYGDLSGSNFEGCQFEFGLHAVEANLRNVSFKDAKIPSGEVYNANLSGADLRGADVRYVEGFVRDFAPSTEATLTGALYNNQTQLPATLTPAKRAAKGMIFRQ